MHPSLSFPSCFFLWSCCNQLLKQDIYYLFLLPSDLTLGAPTASSLCQSLPLCRREKKTDLLFLLPLHSHSFSCIWVLAPITPGRFPFPPGRGRRDWEARCSDEVLTAQIVPDLSVRWAGRDHDCWASDHSEMNIFVYPSGGAAFFMFSDQPTVQRKLSGSSAQHCPLSSNVWCLIEVLILASFLRWLRTKW